MTGDRQTATRRALLTRVAPAALAAGLLAPAGARAAALSATDGSRVAVLLRAEFDALLAYRRAGAADHDAGALLPRTREHVAVLTTQLAAYGLGPYEPTAAVTDLGPHARAVAAAADRKSFLDAAITLETALADACLAAVRALSQPDTLMTVASLLAAHEQLTVWLGRLAVN